MTTNKPGSIDQQPLFGCASCYEVVSYPADHLHVYNGECWCEICWVESVHEHGPDLDWGDLDPFVPALHTECEKLRKDMAVLAEALEDACGTMGRAISALAFQLMDIPDGVAESAMAAMNAVIAAHRSQGGGRA